MTFQIQPTMMEEIREAQKEDPRLLKFREQVEARLRLDVRIQLMVHSISGTEFVYLRGRLDKRY